MSLEIHGMRQCPYAWRVRLVAAEKGVPFEYLPHDVPSPDPRVATHNPGRKSPLLWDGGDSLVESMVIAQYIDESRPGRSLQPSAARPRAQMRLNIELIAKKLEAHVTPEHPADDKLRARVAKGHDGLAKALHGPWLAGAEPDLADLAVWPFLHMLDEVGLKPSGAAADYLARARSRPSFQSTKPQG